MENISYIWKLRKTWNRRKIFWPAQIIDWNMNSMYEYRQQWSLTSKFHDLIRYATSGSWFPFCSLPHNKCNHSLLKTLTVTFIWFQHINIKQSSPALAELVKWWSKDSQVVQTSVMHFMELFPLLSFSFSFPSILIHELWNDRSWWKTNWWQSKFHECLLMANLPIEAAMGY